VAAYVASYKGELDLSDLCNKVVCVNGALEAVPTFSEEDVAAYVASYKGELDLSDPCNQVVCVNGALEVVPKYSLTDLDDIDPCTVYTCVNGGKDHAPMYTQTDMDNYKTEKGLDVCQSVKCAGGILVTVGQPCPPSCKFYTLTQGGWSNKAKRPLVQDIVAQYGVTASKPIIIGTQANNYKFTSVEGIQQAMPSSGTPRSIDGSSTNPKGGVTKNTFAGQLLAVTLDVVYNPGLQNNTLDAAKVVFFYPGLASYLAAAIAYPNNTIDTNTDGKVSSVSC